MKVYNRSVVTDLIPQLQGISDMTGRILYVLTEIASIGAEHLLDLVVALSFLGWKRY